MIICHSFFTITNCYYVSLLPVQKVSRHQIGTTGRGWWASQFVPEKNGPRTNGRRHRRLNRRRREDQSAEEAAPEQLLLPWSPRPHCQDPAAGLEKAAAGWQWRGQGEQTHLPNKKAWVCVVSESVRNFWVWLWV